MSHFIVQSAAAAMPSSCWGRYRRVAVLEVEDGVEQVSMISSHARDCLRVVYVWERQHVGSTSRCAFECALRAANDMAARLNAERLALGPCVAWTPSLADLVAA